MTPGKTIDSYKRGLITAVEAAGWLCELRGYSDAAEFAAEVPEPILAILQERTATIPKPEEVFPVGGLGGPGYVEGSPEKRAEQERYVAWLRTWKAYFESVERVIPPTGEQK